MGPMYHSVTRIAECPFLGPSGGGHVEERDDGIDKSSIQTKTPPTTIYGRDSRPNHAQVKR